MNKREVITQLKDLIVDRKTFCIGDYDPIFYKDIEALEYAIEELERTALEGPVQEQYEGKCSQCDKENKISLPQNMTPKYCMSCGKKIAYIKKDTFYQK